MVSLADLRAASNIIFSNGELDPWNVGGVSGWRVSNMATFPLEGGCVTWPLDGG